MYISPSFLGRPNDTKNRLSKEVNCYDFLDSLSISYERVDHDAADTMEQCQEIEEKVGVKICKNLLLCNRAETQFFLLMMPGDKRYVTKDASKKIGVSRLSFAKENYMLEFLNVTPGSVSVLGLLYDKNKQVQLIIDKDILSEPYVRFHPCINTSTLKVSTDDFLKKILPALGKEAMIISLDETIE